MKTCSYCGHADKDAAANCAGCGTPFVAAKADADAPTLTDPAENLVVVARCRSSVEAYLLRSRLEAAGIEACVPEEFTPQILWYAVPSPLEQVTVRVRARDIGAALQVATDDGAEAGSLSP